MSIERGRFVTILPLFLGINMVVDLTEEVDFRVRQKFVGSCSGSDVGIGLLIVDEEDERR